MFWLWAALSSNNAYRILTNLLVGCTNLPVRPINNGSSKKIQLEDAVYKCTMLHTKTLNF